MTAGRGISHAETTPVGATGALRGLQLWVALPARHRDTAPEFAHHGDLPRTEGEGLTVTVLLGSVAGAMSPARTYTPIVGAEVVLAPGAHVGLPLERGFEHALLALSDDLVVDGSRLERASLQHLAPGRSRVVLTAGPAGGRAFLLGGEPFDEELLMWWNFVARSHDEVVAVARGVDGGGRRGGDQVRSGQRVRRRGAACAGAAHQQAPPAPKPLSLRAAIIGQRSAAPRMAAATWCATGSLPCSRPATVPATSSAERFWLSFHFASTRVISTSRPTMARSWPAT